MAVSSDNWREILHTFSDENGQIFTVTNAPPIIPHIATAVDPDTLCQSRIGSLLRPRLSIGMYPELPFLLRALPVGDPLLSRLTLCVDPAALTPTQYDGGWALADDICNAWIRLEKGLLYVSDLLLTFSEQSSCGTSARYAIRDQAHWPHPEDYGYRKLHRSARGAEISIHRAHLAFQLLVARCSLAIALWLFPGPRDGRVPEVQTSHYNHIADDTMPDWVAFLIKKNVPVSWINAIGDSIITDFSFNLRVGTVFDPQNRVWLPIAPVLRAAKIPVFVLWRNPQEISACATALPFMMSFAPSSPRDVHLALQHPPAGKPRVNTLCRDGQILPYPDHSTIDNIIPPFGLYQLPGESRTDFFSRRERFRSDQERQETQLELMWRRERIAHAQTGLPPYRRSRLYLWVNAQIIFPDLPPRWHGLEYRHPIPPSAYKSIWLVHPPGCRQYNPSFDEWDLWFPLGWETSTDEILESTEMHATIDAATALHQSPSEKQILNDLIYTDISFLIATPDLPEVHGMGPCFNDHLSSWYGITITDTRTFTGVDYHTWAHRLPQIFSEQEANIPKESETRSLIAGWVSAIMTSDLRSRGLANTWDLDLRNPSYLLRDGTVRSSISMEHVRAPRHIQETDNVVHWVLVKFQKDPDSQAWSVLTSAMGALFLARRLREVDTSTNAVSILVSIGVPLRTGLFLQRLPHPIYALPLASRRRMLPPWRKKERPTVSDYDSYCQRVLELAHCPHVRAAWLKGGIVWRIMQHVTGRESPFADLGDGPSVQADHHVPITADNQGAAYYDDGLSLQELDIIAGVVKVYTGNGSQTEDASWWPKHSAWVRANSYTGIWTTWQEKWFQARLCAIAACKEGPLNATEWKMRLKGFKKAGDLAQHVEKASWDFTLRHFVHAIDLDEA